MKPIFCDNFDYEARQSDLERLFRRYGRVTRVDMKSGERGEREGSASVAVAPSGLTLSLDEYYKLSKQAHTAEEQANKKVVDALSLIEIAKESELKNLSKQEKMNSELATKKSTLKFAMEKAEKAKEGRMFIEKELKKRRENGYTENDSSHDAKMFKKKKKHMFPKFFMFMNNKKTKIPKS